MKVERFVAFKQNDAISSAAIAKFLEACKTYSDLAKSVTDVQERLQILNIRDAPDEASLRSVKSLLLEQIGAFFKLLQEPTISKEQHQQITDCYNALEALRQSTAPVKDKPWSDFRASAVSLTTTLKDLVSHPSDPQSKTSMREAYEKLVRNYKGSISDIIAQLQFTYSTAGGESFQLFTSCKALRLQPTFPSLSSTIEVSIQRY
jgi:DnaJ-domain-containing protein 1